MNTEETLLKPQDNSELSLAVLEIVTFLVANGFRAAVADVACIAVPESFLAMKLVCCCVQLMHVGGGALNRVDQARCGINSNVAAHSIGEAFCEAVEPLLAIGHRVHFSLSTWFTPSRICSACRCSSGR